MARVLLKKWSTMAKQRSTGETTMKRSRGQNLLFIGAGLGTALALRQLWKWRNALDLQGQVVLITGSSTGLGLEMAREFARQKARLVICAREEAPLESARRELESMGAEVLATTCDVSKQEQVERMVHEALEHFGQIDIVVNNAGIITVGPLETMELQDFQECMDIMYWGMVYTTLAVLPHLRQRKSGRIVNITSIGGVVRFPHLLPYNCAKAAAVGFSEGLHTELNKEGIKVVTVIPGLMRTGSHVNAFYKGNRSAEYVWFGLGATSPFSAINSTKAAKRIVRATRLGQTEKIITLRAKLATRIHGLFPGLTVDALSLVARGLPSTDERPEAKEKATGKESRTEVGKKLTAVGERAANRNKQYIRT